MSLRVLLWCSYHTPTTTIFFFFFMLLRVSTSTPAATTTTTTTRSCALHNKDCHALLAIKSKIIHDPQGVTSSWNSSSHFCQWEGVTCGKRHKKVTILNLSTKGLAGTLSPYVGNLSFLRVLRIANNTLEGRIPREVGRLFRLQELNLNNNSFGGEIPTNISHCTNLIFLGLGQNKIVGQIPKELRSLLKLTKLFIYDNNLTGGIPPFIGNLTSLQLLSAGLNAFRGSIPDSLGKLKHLSALGLGSTMLSGTIPSSIYNLSFLTVLSLAENQLHGSLPPGLGSMLPHLQILQLRDNLFSGPLPPSISNCSNLDSLEVPFNNFNGKIAINFGNSVDISYVSLYANNLGSGERDEMNFITSLANCSNLQVLAAQENRLTGMLPNSVGNLSEQLYHLGLDENFLDGILPSSIGNLVNLGLLSLEYNQFTGAIPTSIGNLQQLQGLYLAGNIFSGEIPYSMGNLSVLSELELVENKLEGTIPSSLGKCRTLSLLRLSQNNLNGSIPKELFEISTLSVSLDLAGNHLSGPLPKEIGNLKNLLDLNVSENGLIGEIPSSLSSCTSLEILDLEGNFFQGSIPVSLSSLKDIQILDLSRNNFSGDIPRFLEKFSLKKLNLSFNNFEGEIPTKGVFSNRSAISVDGNDRLCGGMPELQRPKCATKESKKQQRRSHLLIIVVSTVCTLIGVTVLSLFLFFWFGRKKEVQPAKPLSYEPFLKVSYNMLLKATDGFASENLIGVGSFSSVYKGILDDDDDDGTVIAIKVLNPQHSRALKSFMAECEAMRSIRHRNLVKVLTSCSSVDFQGNDFKAIIYEFMPNGSLERWLHSSPNTQTEQGVPHDLNLLQRINIAIDVACALDYLQNNCQTPIIHCDLKPSNILLDENMIARVGDFGISKFGLNTSESSSIGIRGTIGYTAPEYGLGSELSTRGDVYSFGILLLEMMTGKRPTDSMFIEGLNLHNYARMALPDGVINIIVGPALLNVDEEEASAATVNPSPRNVARKTEDCLVSLVKIGVACSTESPEERMEVTNVVRQLHLARDILSQN